MMIIVRIISLPVKVTRASLEKYDNEKIVKLLKLEEASTEIFSLDEFGKLKYLRHLMR
jgi:hypothetical protein